MSRDHRTSTPATQAAHPRQRWAKRDLCDCVLLLASSHEAVTLSALLILQFPLPGKEYLMNCSCQESCPCRPLAAQSLALVIAIMCLCSSVLQAN